MKIPALALCCLMFDLLQAQRFTASGPKPILEVNTTQVRNVIPIVVSGLPNNINGSFGLESVCFNINHPEVNNLTIKLVAPDNTKVTLFHALNGDKANLTATCIDDTSKPIYEGISPFTGSFASTLPLGQVNNGQNPNGTWELWVFDDIPNAGSSGTFVDVALTFGANPARPFHFSSSNLPIIEINTQNRAINNYVKENAIFRTYDSPSGVNDWQKDLPTFDGTAYIEWQGWSAPGLPKKNFDFDVADRLGTKIDEPLLGLPAENDWILKAEYNDRTLMKNHLVFDLFQKMGRYAPRTRFCEVVLDGEYVGVYTLQEKIKRDKNRVKIENLEPNELTAPGITGGYIYEINTTGSAFDWTSAYAPINDSTTEYDVEFRVVYPDRDEIPAQQVSYLKSFTDSFETVLASPQYMDSALGYRKYTDVYSFIDFMLISEFAANYDTYGRSFYLVKENAENGGKLKAGPPWDFDQGFGYYWPSTKGWVWQITNYYWPFPFWWSRFWSHEQYRKETECRWKSYRKEALSDSSVFKTIDSLKQRISMAVQRNDFVWKSPNGLNFQDHCDKLKAWITQRLQWIDDSLNSNTNVLPSIPLIADTLVCVGDTLRYPLPNAYLYEWTPGSKTPFLVPVQTGLYTLTATDKMGCFSRRQMNVTTSKPNVNFTINPIQGSHKIECVASDPNLKNYLWWVNNDSISGGSVLPVIFSQNGNQSLKLESTDSLGCSAAESRIHLVNSMPSDDVGFSVFPNPTTAIFGVLVTEQFLGKNYTISDVTGNIIKQGTIHKSETRIAAPWSSGVYLITIDGKTRRAVLTR